MATPQNRQIEEAAEKLGRKLGREAEKEIRRAIKSADSASDLIQRLEAVIGRAFDVEEQALYDSIIASFLAGGARVLLPLQVAPSGLAALAPRSPLPSTAILPPSDLILPPEPPILEIFYPGAETPIVKFPVIEKAGEQLRDARVMSSADYYELSGAAKRQAFTITTDSRTDAIEKVQQILTENVQTATDREAFIEAVTKQVPEIGVSEARLEQVFRNNANGAYSDGTEAALDQPLVGSAFPYRAYFPIRDSRARPEHLALETAGLDGTNVYHYLDPIWNLFRPPWSWNCRCGFIAYTVKKAARKGVKEAQQWLETGVEPVHISVGPTGFLPDPAWQRVPSIAA